MRELSEYLEVFISFLAVSTPFAAAPVFLGLTANFDKKRRAQNANLAALTIFITGIVVIFCGEALFHAFSISIPSFRVGGGLLVLFTGVSMVREGAGDSKIEAASNDVGVVPIAIPLMCGPGLISTIMIQATEAESSTDNLALCACVAVLAIAGWCCLMGAEKLSAKLGVMGLDILTRISGLILTALAVEFIAAGMGTLFPGLLV